MFVAIDPAGLESLAAELESAAAAVRHRARVAATLLADNDVASAIGASLERTGHWGIDAVANLRWRANIIRRGQTADLGSFGVLAVRFATEAVFALDTVTDDYRRWAAQLGERNRRVRDTIAAIGSWLHQGITDWDVTNDDLQHIRQALEDLSPAELDQVIAGLTPRQLTRWIEEMGHGINGFSREEKQQVFAMLASNASGESLGAVHDAILTAPGAAENTADLGIALSRNSADAVIAAFVAHAVGQDMPGHRYAGVAPAIAAGGLDDAAAVDEVVASIVGREGALSSIVVDDVVVAHTEGVAGACVDIAPLETLTSAIAKGSNPELKATVFAALQHLAGDTANMAALLANRHTVLRTKRSDAAADRMLDAARARLLDDATRIILSDPDGVVRHLATSVDASGTAMSDYMFQLVANHRIAAIGRIAAALRPGDQVDPVRFSEVGIDSDYRYPAAQNLAFVAATLSNGLSHYADRAEARIDMVSMIAAIAGALVGPLAPATGSLGTIVSGVVSGGGDWLAGDLSADSVKNTIDDELADLTTTVALELRPQLPLEINPPNLGEALLTWDRRYDAVRLP